MLNLWTTCVVMSCLLLIRAGNGETTYTVVIDAGSTGSRCFVTQISLNNQLRQLKVQPGIKVKPGLSSFLGNVEGLASYVFPLIQNAAEYIPAEYLNSTELHIRGTAGMRLLEEEAQTRVWDALFSQLVASRDVTFIVSRENFGTISGDLEAYYAVLASNYIAGRIDGYLRPVGGAKMLGALDMGGSSTQLVFHKGTVPGEPVHPDHFWSYSWLSYGAEKVQEKLLELIVALIESDRGSVLERRELIDTNNHEIGTCRNIGECSDPSSSTIIYENPCMNIGHKNELRVKMSAEIDEIVQLEGSGDFALCADLMTQILWPQSDPRIDCRVGPRCPIDGVVPPTMEDMHFYGMSAYYYALDCVRELGPGKLEHWPSPTVDELEVAVSQFCSMPWVDDGAILKGRHKFTSDSQLQYRCLEAVYIVTLLEHGFGFNGTHRNITFAMEVDGSEVEWTFGYALADLKPLGRSNSSDGSALKQLFCNSHSYFQYICDLLLR